MKKSIISVGTPSNARKNIVRDRKRIKHPFNPSLNGFQLWFWRLNKTRLVSAVNIRLDKCGNVSLLQQPIVIYTQQVF